MSRRPHRRQSGRGGIYFDETRQRWVGQAPPQRNYATGKIRRRKVIGRQGESYTALAKRLEAFIDEMATDEGVPETVGGLVDQWFKTLDADAPNQSQGNIDRVEHQIRVHLSPVIGDIPMKALTVDDVEAWLANRKTKTGEPLARSTVKKLRSILNQSYKYATKRQYTKWNPAAVADLPKTAPVKRIGRALTPDEINKLFVVCADDRLGAWLIVGITMGLRPGELSGLTWEAVDFDAETLRVFQALSYERGKGSYLKEPKTGRVRTLRMAPLTIEVLEAHRVRQDGERELLGDWPDEWSDLVFVTPRGGPLDRANTRRMVQGLGGQAGIEGSLTSYDIRHTASEYAASKVSVERLADLMGHTTIETVQRHYRHPETNVIDVAPEVWGASKGASDTGKEKVAVPQVRAKRAQGRG